MPDETDASPWPRIFQGELFAEQLGERHPCTWAAEHHHFADALGYCLGRPTGKMTCLHGLTADQPREQEITR